MAVCNYQVFLSFRGPDTRKTFIEHFNKQLSGWGITAFLDSDEIEYGDTINEKIMHAIERSEICIPVFSKDFATSRPCLMEVAQMVKSKKKICPIFFDVEPCDVRHQQKTYEESFAKHERDIRCHDSIKTWKAALREASGGSGLQIKNDHSRCHEIGNFIFELWSLLRRVDQDVPKGLVGIDDYLPEMMRKLGFDYQDGVVEERVKTGRWMLTVWGPSGVGKTTLAWVLFQKISHLFECCSFLENVRDEFKQNRVASLQNKLVCDLKRVGSRPLVKTSYDGTTVIPRLFKDSRVFIVLDNVDDDEQIKLLAQLTWFGPRSRIILTSTTKDVYKVRIHEEQDILRHPHHEISPMEEHRALELFNNCACGPNRPLQDEELSKEIISAVDYLPLAIDIVGNSLYGKSKTEWKRTLGDLNVKVRGKMKTMLEANYELLSVEAKQVFLDIACFFTEVDRTFPDYMWAARDLDGGVDELQKKSFIKIGDKNEFRLYGQLKLLGRETVKKENPDNPGKRSRVWDYEDFKAIVEDKKGTKKVKALRVASNFCELNGEVFRGLSNLRFLELDEVDIQGNTVDLLPHLEWLDWRRCPKKSSGSPEKSKLFAFDMKKMVILNFSSPDKLTLKDWEQLMEKAHSLKVLKLKDCIWVNASLEIPASSLLKYLILEGCLHLELKTINSNFENLVSFNMKHCQWVKHLPQALCSMKALKELLIDGTNIAKLQFEEGSLPLLETLSACECKNLLEVNNSIRFLEKLQKLTLRSCDQLKRLPHVLGKLVRLEEMDLSHTSIYELPPCVKECTELKVLKMVRTRFIRFPDIIKNLKELKELDFTLCGSLSGCCDITGLCSLRILRLKGTRISEVLARDERRFCLHIVELDDGVNWQIEDQSNAE